MTIGSSEVEFAHTAVNLNAPSFINETHDPIVCPECIIPGILSFEDASNADRSNT